MRSTKWLQRLHSRLAGSGNRRRHHRLPLHRRRVAPPLRTEALEERTVLSVSGLEFDWVRQFGTPDLNTGNAVAVDDAGAAYVAGATDNALPGQTSVGGRDAYLRKYDADGNALWTRQFGTSAVDIAVAVAVDAAGSLYAGGTTGGTFPGHTSSGSFDAYLRKYDAEGTELWTRQFGAGGFDSVRAIAVDEAGSVYATGYVRGSLPGQNGAGSADAFLRKFDADGNEVWTRQFGTFGFDVADGVALDATGVYVSGQASGTLPGQASAGDRDAFVRKYDMDGNELWTDQFGTFSGDNARAIAVDSTGVYAAGTLDQRIPSPGVTTHADVFVRKYDVGGNALWTSRFGSTDPDFGSSLALDGTGAYVAGTTRGTLTGQTSAGGNDAFVRKYDTEGKEVETLQFGTAGDDQASGIAVNATGSVYMGGHTTGTLPSNTGAGDFDAYIAKLSTPQAKIAGMLAAVDEMVAEGGVNHGQGSALRGTLDGALAQVEKENTTAAVNQLRAFVHQVEAFLKSGILSPAQGQPLLDAASQVIDQIDGPSAKVADLEDLDTVFATEWLEELTRRSGLILEPGTLLMILRGG